MVVGEGFEPSKLSRQIYNLLPLTTREPHLNGRQFYVAALRLATLLELKNGADTRNRTGDLLITSQLLYQLSYVGVPHLKRFVAVF